MGWLIIDIICGIGWGFGTKAIIKSKGYDQNWFWWGFFFGIIALIVACCKPEVVQDYSNYRDVNDNFDKLSRVDSLATRSDEWRCTCGRVNPRYTGTCVCGTSKYELEEERQIERARAAESIRIAAKAEAEQAYKASIMAEDNRKQIELRNLEILQKLKELLDQGAITLEEYNAKKKELL